MSSGQRKQNDEALGRDAPTASSVEANVRDKQQSSPSSGNAELLQRQVDWQLADLDQVEGGGTTSNTETPKSIPNSKNHSDEEDVVVPEEPRCLDVETEVLDREAEFVDEEARDAVEGAEVVDEKEKVADKGTEVAVEEAEVAVEKEKVAVEEAEVADEGAEVADEGAEVVDEKEEVAVEGAEIADEKTEVAVEGAEVADEKTEVAVEGAEVADEKTEVAVEGAEVVDDKVEVGKKEAEVALQVRKNLIEDAATENEQVVLAIENTDAAVDKAHIDTMHYETYVAGVVEVTIRRAVALSEEAENSMEDDDLTPVEDQDGELTDEDEDILDEEEVDIAGDEPDLADEDLDAINNEADAIEQEDSENAAQEAADEGTENALVIDSNDDDDIDDDDDDDDDEESSSELELTIHGSPAVAAIDIAAAAASSPAFPPWSTATRNRLSAQSTAAGLALSAVGGSRRGNWHYQLFRRSARFLRRRLRRHSTEYAAASTPSRSEASTLPLSRQKPAVFSRVDERNSISVGSGISALAIGQLNQQRQQRLQLGSPQTALPTKPCRQCSIIVHLPMKTFNRRLPAECSLAADAAAAAAAAAAKAASANS